jgi:hypothetical protein
MLSESISTRMSRKQHDITLSEEDRNTLEWFSSTGERKAEDITRARILLKADEGLTDSVIREHLGCSIGTPYRTRKAYTDEGSRRFIAASPTASTSGNSTGLLKHASSNSPVAIPQKAGAAGHCTS